MSLTYSEITNIVDSSLDLIEQCLNSAEWAAERGDDATLHCVAPTRWGECGGMFGYRDEPASIQFTLSAELRAPKSRHGAIAELVGLVNERMWLGHFEFWRNEGVVMFRHTLPMMDREQPEPGEIVAMLTAASEALERFLPTFNFVAWAGKSPEEAIETSMFETIGEA